MLQPRRHWYEGQVAVREGPDDPRPPPDLAVDALDSVVRPDLAPVLRREFRVGKRLGEPVAYRPLVSFCPDELGRHLVELCVERPLVDRYDVRSYGPRPISRRFVVWPLESYDGARAVFRCAVVNLRKKFCVTAVFQTVRSSGYRLAENNRLMRSSKVSGSNIVSGVHCLAHDVKIHALTIEFGRLLIGGCHAG